MGIKISKKTVLKILRKNGFVPSRVRFDTPSWKALFHTYSPYWSMGFTAVFDLMGLQLFRFAIIEVPSKKLITISVPANPDQDWLIQQFRNCSLGDHSFPEAMVHNRNDIYGK
tara:strand:+ start:322 stop:660 length:339 start_codon:yes stop_codon:yes gene_type:complete